MPPCSSSVSTTEMPMTVSSEKAQGGSGSQRCASRASSERVSTRQASPKASPTDRPSSECSARAREAARSAFTMRSRSPFSPPHWQGSVDADRTPEDGLGLQAHAEALLDPRPYAAGEGGDATSVSAVVEDDGQGVSRGEADRPVG